MKTNLRYPLLLAALLAAWQPSKAMAAEEDTQFWLNAFATGEIGDDTTMTVDATQRFRRDDRSGDQHTIRVTVEQQVAEEIKLGGGVGVFETEGGLTEVRVTQQATVKLGRIEARTRLEERFFDGADRVELRFRQRVQYIHPIAKDWRGTAGIEWLALPQPRQANKGPQTDQWRFQVTATHKLNDKLSVGALYWLVVSPRGDRPDRINHIPQVALTWHF